MSKPSSPMRVVRKIVVFFDICSSTSILEDLIMTDNKKLWRDLIIALKVFLTRSCKPMQYDIYKFLGDGWVLLFEPTVSGARLVTFLRDLCQEFDKQYSEVVDPVLGIHPGPIGLTFGLDMGTLVSILMNGRREYMGRPLNVAARLQASIKDKDISPQHKALISRSLYANLKDDLPDECNVVDVTRQLRNISGGENYRCKKVTLLNRPRVKKKATKKKVVGRKHVYK